VIHTIDRTIDRAETITGVYTDATSVVQQSLFGLPLHLVRLAYMVRMTFVVGTSDMRVQTLSAMIMRMYYDKYTVYARMLHL